MNEPLIRCPCYALTDPDDRPISINFGRSGDAHLVLFSDADAVMAFAGRVNCGFEPTAHALHKRETVRAYLTLGGGIDGPVVLNPLQPDEANTWVFPAGRVLDRLDDEFGD